MNSRPRPTGPLVALAVAALAACGGEGEQGPPVPAQVLVSPAVDTLTALGETTQFTAQVLDRDGNPVPGATVTWSSSAPAVAEVNSATGLATARGSGTATITATADGVSGSATLVVLQVPTALVKVAGDAQEGTVGEPLPVSPTVEVRDRRGNPVAGASVRFTVVSGGGSASPAAVTTGTDGRASTTWTLGTDPAESQRLQASAGELSAEFTATARPGPAAVLEEVSGNGQTGAPGLPLPDSLVVRVTDAFGNPVEGTTVDWSVTSGGGTIAPASAASGADGLARAEWTLGPGAGTQAAEAAVPGLQGSPVTFTATVAAGAPTIQSISPDTLVPGGTATINGSNFSETPDQNTVTVAGVQVTVTAATATTLTVALPSSGFPCEPTQPVAVVVTVAGLSGGTTHPLQVARQVLLQAGESVTVLSASDVRCNELAATGGKYVVAVFNTSTSPAASSALQIRGAVPPGTAAARGGGTPRPATVTVRLPAGPGPRASGGERELLRRTRAGHRRVLEENRRLAERLGLPGPPAAPAPGLRAPAALPSVGDTLAFRVPDWNTNTCTNYVEIQGRVVYAGDPAIMVEDIAAPRAQSMDTAYQRVGTEFDNVQYAILRENFGEPLAYDGSLDNNARIFMVFSEVVNSFGNIAGFVTTADFFDRSTCAASDKGEVFYAVVPSDTASYALTTSQWSRIIGGIVIHEVKHLTSYAERFSRGASSLEETWLEESTAQLAEELWARAVFGYGQGGNTDYASSLYCEVRPSFTQCAGKPFVMFNHFDLLYDYYSGVEGLTPLGPVTSDDFSYYGSGWHFLRWTVDHFASSESSFLKALTQETTLRGVQNLEARAGADLSSLLAEWVLANAVDDEPGFTPSRTQLTHPSWNTRSIFSGMNSDFPDSFPLVFPLSTHAVSFGDFTVDVPALRGGTAAYVELTGTQSARQLIEVRSPTGGDPAATLRVAVVRVQ